ncbi:MAG TPA: hypothetical protein VNH18_07485 [Bryobacteraceae bacterium]|nr:hypothetical protein [Bryobacteraceae bacterium]HXJ39104.1 hypothetical protein [Bryobacteraceae bacterium]
MAQHRVDLRNTHERVLCVVPLVGSGTPADPVRPQYAPLPQTDGTAPSRDGIIAFTFQLADDGKHALAEFVAENQSAFKDLLADTNPEVKIFKKGKHKREDIEKEFKKHKKDIDLDNFEVAVP